MLNRIKQSLNHASNIPGKNSADKWVEKLPTDARGVAKSGMRREMREITDRPRTLPVCEFWPAQPWAT